MPASDTADTCVCLTAGFIRLLILSRCHYTYIIQNYRPTMLVRMRICVYDHMCVRDSFYRATTAINTHPTASHLFDTFGINFSRRMMAETIALITCNYFVSLHSTISF